MLLTADTGSIDQAGNGSTLTLCLSDNDGANTWRFDVYALGFSGPVRVGSFQSNAPTDGSGPFRVLGGAHVPGTRAWRIDWTRLTGNGPASLECWASSSPVGFVGAQLNAGFASLVP